MKRVFLIISAAISMLLCTWSCESDPSVELTIDSENIIAPADGGTFVVAVTSNSPSKVTVEYGDASKTGWILLLPSVLKGNGYIEVRISAYDEIWIDRTATITLKAEDEIRTFTVTQTSKAELLVTPSVILAQGGEDGVYTVTVACKTAWTANINSEAASWCTLTGASGEGGKEEIFTVNVAKNTQYEDRAAIITVSGNGMTKTINIQQNYVDYSDVGVVINGLLWAKCNVGEPGQFTTDCDQRGLLYQYDSKVGWPNSSPNESDAPNGYPTGQWDAGHEWLPENNPCPEGWRIPTAEEISALIGKDRKNFYFFDGNGSGPSFNAGFACAGAVVGIPASKAALATKSNMQGGIFLPQAGYRDRDTGKQNNWWDASMTSISQPGQSWDRIVFWINYNQDSGSYSAGNAAAYPIRCVRDLE